MCDRRNRVWKAEIGTLLCAAMLVLAAPLAAQQDEAPFDLSGTWMPVRGEGATVGFPRSDWPFTEKGRALREAFTSRYDPERDDPAFFCVQPGMPMSMAPAAPFPVEIIQRERDITMFFEAWSQYRKIWMQGHDHPDPILRTRMGYSVAHWEDDVLVIETDMFAERTHGRSLMSTSAELVERIRVQTRDDGTRILIDEMVFTDPAIYSEDISIRGVWEESPDTPVMEYVCTEQLYEQHLERVRAETGQQGPGRGNR